MFLKKNTICCLFAAITGIFLSAYAEASSVQTASKIITNAVRINTGKVMREAAAASRNQLNSGHAIPIHTLSPDQSVKPIIPLFTIDSPYSDEMTSLCFNNTGEWLLTGSANGTAQLWNMKTGQKQFSMDGGCGRVSATAFAVIKEKLVAITGHQTGTVCFWDTESGRNVASLKAHKQPIVFIGMPMPPGAKRGEKMNSALFITAALQEGIKIWDADILKPVETHPVEGSTALALMSSGAGVIIGEKNGRIAKWHMNPFGLENVLRPSGASITSMENFQDKFLAVGFESGHVQVWNIKSGRIISDRDWHKVAVNHVGFNDNGTLITSCDHNGDIVTMSLAGGNKVSTLKGHHGRINDFGYLPGEKTLFSAGADQMIRIWRPGLKKEVGRMIALKSGWAVITPEGFFDGI